MMEKSIEMRVEELARYTIDNHLALFGLMMAEQGEPFDVQVGKLGNLVTRLLAIEFRDTIFDGGRRVATATEETENGRVIVANKELLGRVSDEEILTALSKPIAEVIGLTPLSVALAFQAQEERQIRDLTTRATRSVKGEIVKPTEIPEFIDFRGQRFLATTEQVLTEWCQRDVGTGPSIDLAAELKTKLWPEWIDVKHMSFAKTMSDWTQDVTADGPFEILIELCWDSLALSPQSFLRHAARTLRAKNLADSSRVLNAFRKVAEDRGVSDSLHLWSAFSELNDAMHALAHREQSALGADADSRMMDVSVTTSARNAFGFTAPDDLPWELPIVGWSVRELNGLRDLITGIEKKLPEPSDKQFHTFSSIYDADEKHLIGGEANQSVTVRIVPSQSIIQPQDPLFIRRAYSATVNRLSNQFAELDVESGTELVGKVREFYDRVFPAMKSVWQRRLYRGESMSPPEAFTFYTTQIQELMRVPVFVDPFADPNGSGLSAAPTLVLPIGIRGESFESALWVPVPAILSTAAGPPVRVRIVHVPEDPASECKWVCDRALHLQTLQNQPADVMLRSMSGNSLKVAVSV